MSEIISPLLQWLNAHPQLAGLVTFVISAAESVAIIGTIVPGSIMMTALGTLAGAGVIPLWETIFWAILGAIVGDGISYWIGRHFKEKLPYTWPFANHPNILNSGEAFFHKYGGMSVFIGRFVGPVRALVPLVAGMLGMKPLKFLIANVTSAIGWAPAYMLPGILLGAASLELPPDIAIHVILALLLLSLFFLLCLWFVYKLIQLILDQTTQLQNRMWHRLNNSPYFSSFTHLLQHHDHAKQHEQNMLVFYFIITSFLLLGLFLYTKLYGAANIKINEIIYHLFRGLTLRSEGLNSFMINVTFLGQKQILLALVPVLVIALFFWQRKRAAFHLFVLGVLAALGIYTFKHLLQSGRPPGIFLSPATFSMPSGHTVLATTIYIGIAFLIALNFSRMWRLPFYILAIGIAFLVGISRLYLGVHWFTDIVSAWLLGAVILMFIVISYQRYYEKPVPPFRVLILTLFSLILFYTVFHHYYFAEVKTNTTQVFPAEKGIAMDDWWHLKIQLPDYRVSLFGFPSQQLNIEWVGDLDKIKNTLIQEGWKNPPDRDFISILHRIADVKSTQYLPLVSPQYLDRTPKLILFRQVNNTKNFIVIRLWDSSYFIKENNKKLWVGIMNAVPRSYSWLFKKRSVEIEIEPSLLLPSKKTSDVWQTKMVMTIRKPFTQRSNINPRILLVKPLKTNHS